MNTYCVGVTGGSGSGKTSFLKQLTERLGHDKVCLLSQDNYYHNHDRQPKDAQGVANFDTPDSFDLAAFRRDVCKLKQGETVIRQEYTYNNPQKTPKSLVFEPAPILLIEGIFALHEPEVIGLIDLKLFVEAKDYIKVKRRILRDQVERGYDLQDVLYRYENHVMPSYEQYIERHKHEADLIICNNTTFERALDVIHLYLHHKISSDGR